MEHIPIAIMIAYALYEGVAHAFEADHVLAVTNIVSRRVGVLPALKDGVFWGLGHTSTILLIGVVMIAFKVHIPNRTFSCFEAVVGLMLIVVAICRLFFFVKNEQSTMIFHRHKREHAGTNMHLHTHIHRKSEKLHRASYGIGLILGLAGSGALVVLVMTRIESIIDSIVYLATFGFGSIAGMTVVAGLFSLPFSKKLIRSKALRATLVVLSSCLCFVYGCYVIMNNLF
jgi:uncharacterized membrane protein